MRGLARMLCVALCLAAVSGAAERLGLEGEWRWQSAVADAVAPPDGGWTTHRVPDPWPTPRRNAPVITSAWYQREISVPREWNGRRVVLAASYVYSYAAVFVDGRKVGEIRYPAGEVDLTAECKPGTTHTLAMLVTAMPLSAVMLSYKDTASARTVEGKVDRKGLCGPVALVARADGARIDDVRIETSVRKWTIAFDAATADLDANARYQVRVRVEDAGKLVKEFASGVVAAGAHIRFSAPWHPEKLWDTITPQHQYTARVTLHKADGTLLDTAGPTRFGFREFWIDGRDFYLNGTRIFLSAVPLDNAQGPPAEATYEATRATIRRFKSFGTNFVYTHNYGCEPGSHLAFEEVLRAADDEGVLLAFSQPHFGHYNWTAPDADTANGYAAHAAFYARVAGNHASVVCYSTSHNSTGYAEDMNPDLIDGIHDARDQWAERNAGRARRAEALIRAADPGRFVYHHSSGNLGVMHITNFYGNWIPIQEMSDWFEHWATTGVKPMFTCEYSVPFLWDWAMYRGWYKGKREFGGAVVPWEFAQAEWSAQFLGAAAYKLTEEEKKNLRWEAAQFAKGNVWHRWDYPFSLGTNAMEDRMRIVARYITANWRAFRTWGLSGNNFWDYQAYWKTPGYVPTLAAEAILRNNGPVLGYIAGKPDAFTSQDHIFTAGEAVRKQLIVINNSRTTVKCRAAWRALGKSGSSEITLPTGEQRRIPFEVTAAAGHHEIRAVFEFSNGEKQEDTFAFDVAAKPAKVQLPRVALFDPKGETAQLLDRLGVVYRRVDANADLAGFDTLIAGKGALTVDGAAPSIARVRDGLKVIVFEQTGAVLEKRFGFRIAEYGLRNAFVRVADHPTLAGLSEELLRDWRGASTTLAPRLSYERPAQFNYVPTVQWAGIPVPRVWRAGNRGTVASALIEKPARGAFLPVVDGGFALQYAALLEYREGKGLVLFCQMDVTGRTEIDPAAETLAGNILRYAASWKPRPTHKAAYEGDPAGRAYLEAAGVTLDDAGDVLIAGQGARPRAATRTLAFALDAETASRFGFATTPGEHIGAYFDAFNAASPFAGVSPAEVHNRDPRTVPLVNGGVLAEQARVVVSQLAPWQFPVASGRMNVKRTFRRVATLAALLLANLDVEMRTPLLERFAKPVEAKEQRYSSGFYLDTPEEWDDPYRFFRW